MKINTKANRTFNTTHEGAPARRINNTDALRRSVMACLLWEKNFYEDGESIADRIMQLVAVTPIEDVSVIAMEARDLMHLRHVPLLIVAAMAKIGGKIVGDTLAHVIQRPDELAEFLAIYWKEGKCPLSAQVKRGLALAFPKFNEYQLAKYNRDGAVKLRDVLFMCHAKPSTPEQEKVWKSLIDGTLSAPDTWEVALSGGKDKLSTWVRLLSEKKLGIMAFLRNLRNMLSVSVDLALIRRCLLEMKPSRVLPFRFITAAKYAPRLEPELEQCMLSCLDSQDKLLGKTILLVDVSYSMHASISCKGDTSRLDAACGLAILARELCEDIEIYSFSEYNKEIPARRGFALRDAIVNSQEHSSTYLGKAVGMANSKKYDRLIVITDEQSHDPVPNPAGVGYMINVSSNQHGVGYGPWCHIDGWSESVLRYIQATEN